MAKQCYDGQKFYHLTVLKDAPDRWRLKNGKRVSDRFVLCRCDCGKELEVKLSHLKSKGHQSCGCLRKKREDATGRRFGRLLVLGPAEDYIETNGNARQQVLTRCDCGVESVKRLVLLKNGDAKSCGCLATETRVLANTKHGYASRKNTLSEYNIWLSIKQRCRNPNNSAYPRYGGRGINMCDRWFNSFETFLEDVGDRPESHLSIDRINNEGHYEPGNVHWADPVAQANNRRSRRVISYNGEDKTATEWGRPLGLSGAHINARINKLNWCTACAVTKPDGKTCTHRTEV